MSTDTVKAFLDAEARQLGADLAKLGASEGAARERDARIRVSLLRAALYGSRDAFAIADRTLEGMRREKSGMLFFVTVLIAGVGLLFVGLGIVGYLLSGAP